MAKNFLGKNLFQSRTLKSASQSLFFNDLLLFCIHFSGAHGVGRIDIVENRYVGMKSRGKLMSGPTPSFPSCFRIAKNELSVLIFYQWLRKSSLVSLNYPIYTFSSAEASLCCREAGEREERRRTGIPRGPPFPTAHHPQRACYFSITVIFIDYQARASAEERTIYIR